MSKVPPRHNDNVNEPLVKEGVNLEHGDENIIDEGHGDNAGRHPGSLERATHDKGIVVTAESYSVRRFVNLPFTLQWGLTDSIQMDNSHDCRDMLANNYTPADDEFLKRQQSNVLLRFENLSEEHANLVYAHESYKEMKARYKECKKDMGNLCSEYDENKGLNERVEELDGEKKRLEDVNAKQMDHIRQLEGELEKSEAEAHQLRWKMENFVVLYENREVVRQKIIKDYLPTFVRRLHQSAEYKRSLGEVFSLAIGKGFIDGISIGQKEEDIHAILVETSNMDPAALATFMEKYKAPFNKRCAVPPCHPWSATCTSHYDMLPLLDMGLPTLGPIFPSFPRVWLHSSALRIAAASLLSSNKSRFNRISYSLSEPLLIIIVRCVGMPISAGMIASLPNVRLYGVSPLLVLSDVR
ncbi:hypothetical protein Tco_1243381 [Tanacetum coccineum]